MSMFRHKNLEHIRDIFQKKTGVELPARRAVRQPVRLAAAAAAMLACCLSLSAFAYSLFSALDGNDLSLQAIYEGNGVVSIAVENRSGKDLQFQEALKLMRWAAGTEVKPLSGQIAFSGTRIPAHSGGTMTVDLSKAYDIAVLEQPLAADDWYYLVLTNNNFVFGQDWMCSVEFCEPVPAPPAEEPQPVKADEQIVQEILEELRPYFERISFDTEEHAAMNTEYMDAVESLFSRFEGRIVPSVSPWLLVGDPDPSAIFDSSVPPEEQYLLVSEHYQMTDWNFKLLAADEESALVLSATVPLQGHSYAEADIPFLYIFTYERDAVDSGGYAFIYGQLLSFSEMEQYKVYEDGQYVCYEVSSLIYSDLQQLVGQHPDIQLDSQAWTRLESMYQYYKENVGNLFYYK